VPVSCHKNEVKNWHTVKDLWSKRRQTQTPLRIGLEHNRPAARSYNETALARDKIDQSLGGGDETAVIVQVIVQTR